MDFRELKKLTIGGVDLVQLFINGVQVFKAGYKNWVKYSTESDGVTIYNGGLGYKNGYRIRSGGAEAAQDTASCTGFIPVKGGDIVRISGVDFSKGLVDNAVNVSDSGFTNIGQMTPSYHNAGYGIFAVNAPYQAYCFDSVVKESDGVWKWVLPPATSGVAYIRVTGYTKDGSNLIVTVNEEIA